MAKLNKKTNMTPDGAEGALSEGALFEMIIASIDYGVSVQDTDLRIIFANEVQKRMFGADIIGKFCYEIYERRDEVCPDCPVVEAFGTGEAARVTHRGLDRDDNAMVVEISASPIRDDDGSIIAAVEVVRDVTDLDRTRRELERQRQQIMRLADVSREIASGFDLKTIMESVVRKGAELTGAEAGTIAMHDRGRRVVTYPFHFNMPDELERLEVPEDQGVAGHIIATGETVLLDDYSKHGQHLSAFSAAGVTAILAVPLAVGDRILGAIGLFQKTRGKTFSEEDREVAQVIADQAAIAIDNARLLEKTLDGLKVQRELNEVAVSISSGLELNNVLAQVGRHAADVVAADASMVALLDEDNDVIRFPVSHNLPDKLCEVTTPREEGLAASVIACGRPRIVNDYQNYQGRNPEFAAAGVRAVATVPLKVSERCVGAIGVMDTGSGRQFDSGDIEVLGIISRQAAVAVENARLYEELSSSASLLEDRVRERTEELERLYQESQQKSKELEEANIRLKEVDQLKSEFLANMSHELRTPLNSIIGFSKLILDGLDGGLNSEQKRDLEIVHTSGQALIRMIDDLLNLAKIEAGRLALDLQDEDPARLAEDVVRAALPFVEQKGLELLYEAPQGLNLIKVDASRIRQVIRYLVDNAVKFTDEGTIRVTIEETPEGTCFAVADTGIGLDADQIDAVFERFHQVTPGLAEKGGMGLGLAISKRLVEMHGGSLSAESRPGRGSVFSFCIPRGSSSSGSGNG